MTKVLFLSAMLALATIHPCSAQKPSKQWFTIASELVHEEAFAGAHDVELSGNLAFVPGKGGSIAIIDVADPEKPDPPAGGRVWRLTVEVRGSAVHELGGHG